VQHGLHGRGPDEGLKESRRVRYDRDRAAILVRRQSFPLVTRRQKIVDRHVLRSQNPVHSIQRKLPAAMQKIRQMRFPKTSLARQQRDANRPPLYPAQQFQSKSLVHLGKIHLWIVRHQQWGRMVLICLMKT
jgi:hypothetical protein